MKKPLLKRILLILFLAIILIAVGIVISDSTVTSAASGRTFDNLSSLPRAKVGLLLGTSKYVPNGNVNQHFKNRIDATIELFKSGKIQYIIVSGDNSRSTYDEPNDMKAEPVKKWS